MNKQLIKKRMKLIYKWVLDNYLQELSNEVNYIDMANDVQFKKASPKAAFMGKCPIWIYWEQGIEDAPELVKMCFSSVLLNAGEGMRLFRYHLII